VRGNAECGSEIVPDTVVVEDAPPPMGCEVRPVAFNKCNVWVVSLKVPPFRVPVKVEAAPGAGQLAAPGLCSKTTVTWTRSRVIGVVGVAVHGKFPAVGVAVQLASPASPTQLSKVADVMSRRVAVTVVVNRTAEQFDPVA
jgi:hypothetical protein